MLVKGKPRLVQELLVKSRASAALRVCALLDAAPVAYAGLKVLRSAIPLLAFWRRRNMDLVSRIYLLAPPPAAILREWLVTPGLDAALPAAAAASASAAAAPPQQQPQQHSSAHLDSAATARFIALLRRVAASSRASADGGEVVVSMGSRRKLALADEALADAVRAYADSGIDAPGELLAGEAAVPGSGSTVAEEPLRLPVEPSRKLLEALRQAGAAPLPPPLLQASDRAAAAAPALCLPPRLAACSAMADRLLREDPDLATLLVVGDDAGETESPGAALLATALAKLLV